MTSKAATDAQHLPQLLKLVTAVKELESKLDGLEREKREPIAIIGMGCRFPGGADSPDRFWNLLMEGGDAVTEMPASRLKLDPWSSMVEPDLPLWGAFLNDVDLFDAEFFGISPREAAQLDPQQRLLLEVAWEALEHGGVVPKQLLRTPTGVFVGITCNDYMLLSSAAGPANQDAYTGTGNGHCFPAGRLSYFLGVEGPSLAIDTACASSLVAVHLACQSLRNKECTLALAGGVNLALSLQTTQLIKHLDALSPDGRCNTFDARANGYVRGEGCGIVVLKRLSDALASNDRILAVIRGSAVNQDGRSNGLTAPNLLAQQALLRKALDNARVSPAAVGFIETHGTGTSLGDPIEVAALTEVFGQPRQDGSPCVLGALKTNIGHLEPAAGVAGLMKVVLSLERETIPKNLHFKALNPRINLEGTPFVIPTSPLPWAAKNGPRLAGVSAFGMSGTNAHMIVEEAPRHAPQAQTGEDRAPVLVPLSAHTGAALDALLQAYLKFLGDGAGGTREALRDIAYTASVRRSHHERRLAITAHSKEELGELLRAALSHEPKPGIARGEAKLQARPKIVFVFSGQGTQWIGMGRELLSQQPIFRTAVTECDALIRRHAPFSILEQLAASDADSRIHDTEVAQPAIFSIQVGLSALLSSVGVKPAAVIGHSVGEIAAAHIAGILSLEDACQLVALRGRIMQQSTAPGKMAAVALRAEEAESALKGYEDRLDIAAKNDPESVVISGEAKAMDELTASLKGRGVNCRPLHVNYGFHSPLMTPLAQAFQKACVNIKPQRGTLPMYSTTLGGRADGTKLDAAYWAKNIRDQVQFARAVELAVADRQRIFLEVGPHPALAGNIRQCLSEWKAEGDVVPSLRREQPESESLYQALGTLYTLGCEIDFRQLFPEGGQVVSLPTYPWQRQRHWLKLVPAGGLSRRGASSKNPLEGSRLAVAGDRQIFETVLSAEAVPGLLVHQTDGHLKLDADAVLELALSAVTASLRTERVRLSRLLFTAPLLFSEAVAQRIQVIISPSGGESLSLMVYSQACEQAPEAPWTLHLSSQAERLAETALARPLDSNSAKALPAPPSADAQARGAHSLLTGDVIHSLLSELGISEQRGLYEPSEIGTLTIWQRGSAPARVQTQQPEILNDRTVCADLRLVHASGVVMAEVVDLRMQPMGSEASRPEEVGNFKERLAALPVTSWMAEIEAAVRADVASVLLLSSTDELLGDRPLYEVGMDSLMAVQIRHELARRMDLPLPSTMAFDYPTIFEIAQYLHGLLTATDAGVSAASPEPALQEQAQ